MKYKIFVSGVQKELKAERIAVQEIVEDDVLLNDYFKVFLFEKAPAGSKSSKFIYLKKSMIAKYMLSFLEMNTAMLPGIIYRLQKKNSEKPKKDLNICWYT